MAKENRDPIKMVVVVRVKIGGLNETRTSAILSETRLVRNRRLVSAWYFCITNFVCSFRNDNNFKGKLK